MEDSKRSRRGKKDGAGSTVLHDCVVARTATLGEGNSPRREASAAFSVQDPGPSWLN